MFIEEADVALEIGWVYFLKVHVPPLAEFLVVEGVLLQNLEGIRPGEHDQSREARGADIGESRQSGEKPEFSETPPLLESVQGLTVIEDLALSGLHEVDRAIVNLILNRDYLSRVAREVSEFAAKLNVELFRK